MNDSRLASRYARALFLLVKERNQVEKVKQDLSKITGLLADSPEFKWLLESPVIISSEKARMVKSALSGLVEPITLEFLQLLIHHRREGNLSSTCRMFMELFKGDQGIMDAKVESAIPVDVKFLDGLKMRLEESSHRKIEMKTETNEALIGGFILTLEDQQLDASVLSKLKRIRQELRESKK
ncbi:MAG: ATP synthase F1 subunit delta [Bacteroidia bacterium]|nr:ATP synthase F1 subunit delta [Bacteroidia bacterium]